jgi:radical SAM protein with 4Fe4S-binding SPASM domain
LQPETDVKFDSNSFNRIKRTIRNMSLGRKQSSHDPSFAMDIPDEVGIQLTNKCDLRCKHCFQWNENGFHKDYIKTLQQKEIDFGLIRKIFNETSKVKSNLYLWGGEPLCYSRLPDLSLLLEGDPRWTVFCTNGIAVKENIDALCRMSKSCALLISLDGFQIENDSIRGKGKYDIVMNNIKLLLDLKKKGTFQGEISVNCVINYMMIGKLYDFALMFEHLGINSLYFCFPWYISQETAERMDTFFKDHFSWLLKFEDGFKPSWHSYTYKLDPGPHDVLKEDIKKLNGKKWKIRMRLQPALEMDEIADFIEDKGKPAQDRSKCIGIRNRMNVTPDGKVTACKMFPEFTVGDLNEFSVTDVWRNDNFRKAREIINGGLMPICSKCILLYLHGV